MRCLDPAISRHSHVFLYTWRESAILRLRGNHRYGFLPSRKTAPGIILNTAAAAHYEKVMNIAHLPGRERDRDVSISGQEIEMISENITVRHRGQPIEAVHHDHVTGGHVLPPFCFLARCVWRNKRPLV